MLKIKKSILMISFFILIVICYSQSGVFANDKIEISFSAGGLGPEALQRIGAEALKECFEEKVGDKAYMVLYTDLALGTDSEVQEMLRMGSVDMMITASNIPEIAPIMGIFDMPFLFTNREDTYTILDGPIGERLGKSLEKIGIIHLAYGELGFRCITNNVRPIKSPEDLKGILLRTPRNKTRIDAFNMLGASATPIPYGDLYMALQQGVVDGQENPITSIYAAKFYEVQKYLSLTNHVFTPLHVLVNADFYNNLPNDVREALNEASLKGMEATREQGKINDEEILVKLKEGGMIVNEVDTKAFVEKAKQIWEKYEDQYGEIISVIIENN